MRLLFSVFLILTLASLTSCMVISGKMAADRTISAVDESGKQVEKTEPEKVYDKSDPFWQQKKEVDRMIPGLAAPAWQDREKSEKQLTDFIVKADGSSLDYFILQSAESNDPEINFRGKNVLKAYFRKTVYDPDQKKGFIGLQLMEQGPMRINNENYRPIRVVLPQDGFPGKAAGIMAGDLILGVDGRICGKNFTMNDFIMYIASLKPGTEIILILQSIGEIVTKKIKLAPRPETLNDPAPKQTEEELFNSWYNRKKLDIRK